MLVTSNLWMSRLEMWPVCNEIMLYMEDTHQISKTQDKNKAKENLMNSFYVDYILKCYILDTLS